jgi:dTMP kinase
VTGYYLAIEGGEGVGKTTVVGMLTEALTRRGEEVVSVREPGSTELGDEVRRLLLHWQHMSPWAEALLYAAQRAQLVSETIAPALARGAFVLSDRSLYSSLAYQGAARGLGIEPVRTVNELAVSGLFPDLVAVLMVDVATALSRQQITDRIGGEDDDFHEAVVEGYRTLAAAEPERVRMIEVDGPPGAVADQILRLIDQARGDRA